MARTNSKESMHDGKVTPLKDPLDRNQEALDRALDVQADLEREIARREELEAQREELKAKVEHERELRTQAEEALRKASQMMVSLNADRLLRDQRPSRRKRPFRGRQTL